MKIFLDTNILVDFLTDRGAFTKHATEIFLLGTGNVLLYSSTHAFATTYYILKKYSDEKELRAKLLELTELVDVLDVTKAQLKKALISDFNDFEDALQIFNAESTGGMDYIVTRNLRDFRKSPIPAIAPDEMVEMIKRLKK
ncbi:type II toxin-antitoxin system VapC family toxin [Aquiflexum gelatinilyticum]|uniref:type II toxin-antitoxin system VapC family toxin n=1 Tax=Aquiflexum gelatinilyticum TaxID=2961943 RepID=UPI002169F84B|nr:PIN domain-containing protein [Aquiflexum gelatinilyticum]MCS4436572.1 PIN domain-containing protein [Aquiflexum gelatinilyticum]